MGGRERETGKKKRRGQERRKKEMQQSGVLSCFSVALPSFSWGMVPTHLTQLLCRH